MLAASPTGTRRQETEVRMNEDRFNMEMRKFLKKVGVTSQREIERTVQEAIADGRLQGNETLKARVKLSIEGLDLDHEIDGDISLS
jgi:ribosomal protein L1